jgi:hypothetical protein
MSADLFVPVCPILDAYNRLTLPKHFSDRIPWIPSTDDRAWLLLLAPGRYRLLSDGQVQSDPRLEPVRLLILGGKAVAVTEPTHTQDLRSAATVARLVPIPIAYSKQCWRISLPEHLDAFAPPDCDPKAFSVFFSLEGYWEIWCTNLLRRSALLPLA